MTEKVSKVASVYRCETCDYECSNKTNFTKHTTTQKHINRYNSLQKQPKRHICGCGREYAHRQGLHYHKTTCNGEKPSAATISISDIQKADISDLKNILIEFIKSNSELKKQLADGNKISVVNSNINSNNKAFNINVFLNETCKDAINFSDFVKNIEVTREDLENNAQLGFVNGISKILIDNLRELSITERPIHCTDLKREIMYVKDDNKWTKDENKSKMSGAILSLSQKSARTLLDWKKENPDYQNHDSDFSNRCIVIQRHSMAGYDRDTYYPKVIRAIAKEIMVDK